MLRIIGTEVAMFRVENGGVETMSQTQHHTYHSRKAIQRPLPRLKNSMIPPRIMCDFISWVLGGVYGMALCQTNKHKGGAAT